MSSNSRNQECTLTCRSFLCSKKMLRIVTKGNIKNFFCKMDEDTECFGYMCNYAECRERKMNDSGLCLRPVKIQPQNIPLKQKQDLLSQFDYVNPNDLDDKIRKKLSKNFN